MLHTLTLRSANGFEWFSYGVNPVASVAYNRKQQPSTVKTHRRDTEALVLEPISGI